MNKNIKRIVAIALMVGTVSATVPNGYGFDFLITEAYAASTNSESNFDSLELNDADGSNIRLYEKNDYKDKVDKYEVSDDTTYYAKTSSNKVSVDIDGIDDDFVRVFGNTSDSARGKKVDDLIQLSDDSVITTLTVNVYGDNVKDETVRFNDTDDNKYNLLSSYEIKIRRVKEEEIKESDFDSIYLERLSIGGQMINLSENVTTYTCNVSKDIDEVVVRATPEDENYDVSINGEDAAYDDNYKRTVGLDKDKNEIKIQVERNGKIRIYTVIVNKGNTVSNGTDTSATNTNKWVQANDFWKYYDAAGNQVKNAWVQNHYLNSEGNMGTGWLNINGSWYYFGFDGTSKTGWQDVNGVWYFLNQEGKMQTGWIKDTNGKYYYLQNNGAMAYNTKINGFKVGLDGAWIK